jgi:methylglutaconyl-CoA hydratase
MSAADEPLHYEVRGAVARITMDRPEKRNALDAALIRAIHQSLDRAETDPVVRVIALTGAGPDFCAGADLAGMRGLSSAPVMDNLDDAELLADLLLRMRSLRLPIVALVRGRALAGGCGLATACDLVVAAERATFGYPEICLGFVPAMVMALLRRNVAEKRAFELIALGETLSATEAKRFGLVNRVHPDESFDVESDGLLQTLATRSPSALRLAKRLLYQQDGLGFEAAVRAGVDVNVLGRLTDDARAGMERFLRDRGEPG